MPHFPMVKVLKGQGQVTIIVPLPYKWYAIIDMVLPPAHTTQQALINTYQGRGAHVQFLIYQWSDM